MVNGRLLKVASLRHGERYEGFSDDIGSYRYSQITWLGSEDLPKHWLAAVDYVAQLRNQWRFRIRNPTCKCFFILLFISRSSLLLVFFSVGVVVGMK